MEPEPPLYLAPMEGVTDRSFRGLTLDTNGVECVGAVCTEFLRVSNVPLPAEKLGEEMGRPVPGVLTGIQLMGNRADLMAETAIRAAEVGADFVDLNFGCPAPKVFQHRAGAALLEEPERLEAIVAACVERCPKPVTAKIRAGSSDSQGLEDICRRIESAGATWLTVHGRLRIQKYTEAPDWTSIQRAKAVVGIPVIGNGDAVCPDTIDRMMAETGCDAVMIGRGALKDPLLFRRWGRRHGRAPADSPLQVDLREWLLDYHRRMRAGGASPIHALGRIKHAIKGLDQGGRLPGQAQLRLALREKELEALLTQIGLAG